jgi:cytochrome c oxidase subunit II
MQTVLDPSGPGAGITAGIAWVLFVGAALIFAATMAAAAVALFGAREGRWRRALASRRFILGAGVAFPLVTLTALLLYTLVATRAMVLPPGPEPLRIEVIGRQFWWEVRYPGAAPGGAAVVTANELHLPVGRDVEFLVSSPDVIHSLWIPNLHGKIDMIPGRVNRLRVLADRPGVFRGQCAEFCGAQHALMALFAVAEPPEAFERWLDRQRLPVEPPQDPVLALGMRAFGAAGCGGCHAVRGTEWEGALGPDLSRVGGRISLAAGALDNHRGTLAGWIAGAQDVKPGNLMPSFSGALDGPELRALAAWLESLK